VKIRLPILTGTMIAALAAASSAQANISQTEPGDAGRSACAVCGPSVGTLPLSSEADLSGVTPVRPGAATRIAGGKEGEWIK
jgi:hypothetical protein